MCVMFSAVCVVPGSGARIAGTECYMKGAQRGKEWREAG